MPPPAAAVRSDVDRAIDQRVALARQHLAAGDPRAAAVEWQILTLLAPQNPDFRRELAASRDAAQRGARERLDAARAAQRNGQAERAVEAYVQALASNPATPRPHGRCASSTASAMPGSRPIARPGRRTTMAAPARTAPGDGPGDGYDLDQALEMLAAGDLAGGLRDLKAWVEANPRQRATRQRIGAAVYDKGRELEAAGAREQALSAYESAVALAARLPRSGPPGSPRSRRRSPRAGPSGRRAAAAPPADLGRRYLPPNFSFIFFVSSSARSRSRRAL